MPEQATVQSTVQTIEAVTRVTVLFALVLALSFVIERILEVLKSAFDMFDSRHDLWEFWTARANGMQRYIERQLRLFEYVDRDVAAATLRRFDEMLLGARDGHSGAVPLLCGDLVRVVWIRSALKLLGMAIGILFAFSLELDLLAISRMPADAAAAAAGARLPQTSFTGLVLTGIVVGLGSGIVHKVISTIERRQKRATATEVARA